MGPDPIDKAKSKLIYSKDLPYDGGIIDSKGKGLETHYVIRHNPTDDFGLDYRPLIAR